MAKIRKNIDRISRPVLLALETATTCGSIALVADGECIAEYSLHSSRTHSQGLLVGIAWLMREAELGWEDIDGLAVSLGPGSFTGLRIGLSTAKGLAMATEKPLVGIGTLDGLAVQVCRPGELICPVLDARKNEVYTAFFRWQGDDEGECRRVSDYLVLRPEALCGMIREPVIMTGDGLAVYGDLFREKLAGLAVVTSPTLFHPRAAAIGMLAIKKWRAQDFLDPAGAVPIYVRSSEAEIHFGALNKKQNP